jgi:asparagine N-glycosylation enzyme membrane subunit Stt3
MTIGMEEGEVIRIRKDKILGVFKGNKAFATFLIISILAFLFSFLRKIDFAKGINIFDTSTWFILGILAGVSAFVSYHKKYGLSFYPILGWLVWISVKLRTRNVDGLRDVSTGGWTLGPDLDPFLFLRWAKAIVQDGTLYALDTMRYVPRGFQTKSEMFLLPYLIAWFHKVAVIFGSGSVEQSAAIFPVFMFAITVVAFFFLTRKILIGRFGSWKASIAAVISSFFLLSIPSLLPRTIAGIPEKESAAFFFLFMAFYFFLCAWQTKKMKWKIVNAVIAGIMTASMAIIWGGFIYIFVTLALTMFIAFVLGQVKKDKLYV